MLEDPQIMTTPMSITSFLHCSCRMLEPMAFDQAIRWQPENRQSGRGLLSEPENLVTYRDRRTRGSQCCRLFGKSWAGDPTNTILQEPPQPTSMAQPQGDIPASQGTAQKIVIFCAYTPLNSHTPVPRAGTMNSCHHVIPGETEAMVQQVIRKTSTASTDSTHKSLFH